ncbi:MAG TPA: DUF2243 domain-containing protein, partial [Segetibacter sp.]
LILGWGLFNLLEGIADHQVLKLHNVREVSANKDLWNYGFLAFAIVLIVLGSIIAKQNKNDDDKYALS